MASPAARPTIAAVSFALLLMFPSAAAIFFNRRGDSESERYRENSLKASFRAFDYVVETKREEKAAAARDRDEKPGQGDDGPMKTDDPGEDVEKSGGEAEAKSEEEAKDREDDAKTERKKKKKSSRKRKGGG